MPTMLPIESKMELFARAYTKDTGIRIEMGSNFATNGKVIFFPPIPDQCDKYLRRKSEMAGYHEIGHCLKTDWASVKVIKATGDALMDELANWVEDIYVEGIMETRWPGIKIKYAKYFPERVAEYGNDRLHDPMNPLHNNLMRLLYYRCREKMLGLLFGVSAPAHMEKLYQKLIAKFEPECIKARSTKETVAIAQRIYDVLKQFSQTQPPQPKPQPQRKPQKGNEKGEHEQGQSGQPSDSSDSPDSEEGDSKESDKKDSNGEDSDEKEKSGGSEKPEKDSDEKDGDSEGTGGDADSDEGDSEGKAGDTDKKDSAGEDSAGEDSDSKDPSENGGGAGGCEEDPTPEDLEAAKKLAEEQKAKQTGDTDADATKKDVNRWATTLHLLTKAPGLKENVFTPPESRFWQSEVELHSRKGRELTGFLGTKLRTLLISERAPRWQTNLETGRVDSRRLHRVITGASKSVFKRRIPAVYEDAAVSMVVDYSSSMRGENIEQALALLTSLSENLDRLRVPFETFGFLNGRDNTQTCMRTNPAQIAVLKSFNEPFRRVKHRFTEGLVSGGTNEFPAIELAARSLAQRRETKKILFILTDGCTAFGNSEINQASRDAMKDFILRLMRAGMRVVGFGIGDDSADYYCPEFVMVDDKFAATCYAKLLKILV